MGEARQKSRHKAQILQGEERCIYCTSPPTTVEHMPPKSMFPNSHRLSGMEFAACLNCNHSTRAADAAASFLARLSPSNVVNEPELQEARKLLRTLTTIAPGFVRELFDQRTARGRDSFYGRKRKLILDGPVTHALLRAFSAKLGMALYREHVSEPLPEEGMVFTQHYLNAGLQRDEAEATLKILPALGQLRQGRQSSGRLFNYRYNSDNKTVVAALAAFNDNFFVRVFATCDKQIIDALLDLHEKPPVSVGGLPALSSVWNTPFALDEAN